MQSDHDNACVALCLAACLLDVPAEPAALREQTADLAADDLPGMAARLGLRAARRRLRGNAWAALPGPALVRAADGRWLVLARIEGERALVHQPGQLHPRVLSLAGLAAASSGEVVLLARREPMFEQGRMAGLRWLLRALGDHRRPLLEVLLAALFLQLLGLATPLGFQVVIDKVLVHHTLATLDVLVTGLVLATLAETVLAGLRHYLLLHTANRIDVRLGSELLEHLLRLPQGWFEQRRIGDTVARVRELDSLREVFTGTALAAMSDLVFVGVCLAVLYLYSPTLWLLVLASLPVYGALALLLTPLLRTRLDEQVRRGADTQAFLVETLGGIGTLKSAAAEPVTLRRWNARLVAFRAAGFRAAWLGGLAGQGAALVNRLTTLAILWLGARLVIDGALTVGELVAFNMLSARVAGPVLQLSQLWQAVQQAGIALRRVDDILAAEPEPAPGPARAGLAELRGRIELQGLHFRYPGQPREVLAGIDLALAPGEVLGIVGPSGSGKSTLARLLQGLAAPGAGRILYDGVDIGLLDPAWLRRRLGVVLQDARLFNASIRDNIALAEPGMPRQRITAAACLAGAHAFITALPAGYDTAVVEQGGNLSGGQRQRIAIARALAGDPRVLLLDEATSALDVESEAALRANMASIRQGRTVIIIAHRLSAVRQADRIAVLDGGRIVECDTHQALLGRGGMYARLHRMQSGSAP